MTGIHPNLSVAGAKDAIEFYVRAFGAEVLTAVEAGGAVVHSDLRLGDSTFTVAEAWPSFGSVAPTADGPTHASFTIEVDDTDAAFARAVDAGATAVGEPADEFHGGRIAQVRCPFGHRWFLNHQVEELTSEELQRRVDAWAASTSPEA
jgi:PhnB protein